MRTTHLSGRLSGLRSSLLQGLLLSCLALAGLPACEKEKPKEESKKTEATPVPSNLTFNDFLPQNGNGAAGLGVRDAGIEGGLAEVQGGGDPAAGAEPGEQATVGKMKVTEPGAEPRSVRKYTFAVNKPEKRVLTITQSQSGGGQNQDITIKISVDFTAKAVKPSGAQMEAKVTKVDLPGAPPQAAQMLAAMNGLMGVFEISPRGEVGEVQFAGTPQMQNQLAQTVVGGLSQAVQLLVAPLPEAPIGVGAKWEASGAGAEQQARRFTLKEIASEVATIDTEIDVKVPKHQQRGPGGIAMLVEADGKGKYTYQTRFDRVANKVEGELSVKQKIEVNDPRAGGKQQVEEASKTKHLLEIPPK